MTTLELAVVLMPALLGAPDGNVVLVVLDGVRPLEVLRGPDPALSEGDLGPAFPRLHGAVRSGATVLLGDPDDDRAVRRLRVGAEGRDRRVQEAVHHYCWPPARER